MEKPIFVKALKEMGDLPALYCKMEDIVKVSESKTLKELLNPIK
jgi:hypothetical protein